MAEYNEDDLDAATRLIDFLRSASQRHIRREPFPIEDVRKSFDEFDEDAMFARVHGLPGLPTIPHMYDDLPVTIAISEFVERLGFFGELPRWRQALSDKMGLVGATFLPEGEVREAMHILAARFIASRSAGTRELAERSAPALRLANQTTPGCVFDVHTVSTGLRVHWSGAYRISGNYFGHPTSPTSSTLQSGVYIFGVDGGAYTSTQWDTATKVTLPGPHTSIKLNY